MLMGILDLVGELFDWVGDGCDAVLMDLDLRPDSDFSAQATSLSQCGPDLA